MNARLAAIPFLNKRIRFPVTPHIPGGLVTPEQLRQMAAVAEKYGGTLKIIGGSITIMGLSLADGQTALAELGASPESFIAKSVRSVAMCPGKPHCPMAAQDSSALGLTLDSQFFGQDAPAKVRLGVSGCPNCCAEVFIKDIGLFGTAKGFTLVVGGNAGRQAQIARIVAVDLPPALVPGLVAAILTYYRARGKEKERLGTTLDRTGWEPFLAAVIPEQYRATTDTVISPAACEKASGAFHLAMKIKQGQ
ncbi:MAG: nitrite reductase [Negativicutes bacterium]|nr:nitrite reductase [Negativicutes bacterium]